MGRRSSDEDDQADRDLLARIARSDRAALDAFYARHAREALAYVREIVHIPELAEEVASDAMIAVWTSAGRYRGDARVTTWLLSIAHHKALGALRRRGHALSPLDAALDLPINGAGPEEIVIRRCERVELERALATLTPEHRAVLQLMFAFSRTLVEISEIVKAPVATVKTRLFYAKRRLRDALEQAAAAQEIA